MIQDQVNEAKAFLKRNSGTAMYLKPPMEIAAINCVWQLLSGDKYDLEDPQMRSVYHILSEGFSDQNMVGITCFLPWLAKLLPDYTGYSKGLRYLEGPDQLGKDILRTHMETYNPDKERDFIDVALTRIYNTTDPKSMFYKDVGCKRGFVN
ncbi:unnamed protein product [Allacma fusca]|uniref:Uncharacterized protein n=1 Tax=Allacma fusca TaxID=39272 RepID=A0A8J2KJS8_9HEXA|nr:unnamed protein product [Allacma fusca]